VLGGAIETTGRAQQQSEVTLPGRRLPRPPTPRPGKGTARGASSAPPEPAPLLEPAGGAEAKKSFSIVGIGASAGGLEAITELLKHLPTNSGMAFVVVQHLDPTRKSALTEIIGRATTLPVAEVTDGVPVQPDHVYIIPPGHDMTIAGGKLHLSERHSSQGVRRAIDFFFESLAADQGVAAIGVVLSGTATDGTLGLEAIKAEGGLTFAQDETAKYGSMPDSAAAAGYADAVLPPKRIAQELARIARHPFALGGSNASPVSGARSSSPASRKPRDGRPTRDVDADPEALDEHQKTIFHVLRKHSGIDFTLYKPSTMSRRIQRRMMISQMDTIEAYAGSLRGNAAETSALHDDMLITLTGFFRNPAAFEALKTAVFSKLTRPKREKVIRVWVAGCSTGQEAYSVVMTYLEATEGLSHAPRLQVFATDVSQRGVDGARGGLYPKIALAHLSPERVERFFEEEDSELFRIRKTVREKVVFAHHDILRSPPFSHLDLVTCRNLLIYLRVEAQRRVFSTFARALDPGSFLFLGASESPASVAGAFVPVDEKNRIFARTDRDVGMEPRRPGDSSGAGIGILPKSTREGSSREAPEVGVQRAADRVAADRYAPNGVVIDSGMNVVEVRGDPQPWITLSVGRATLDVRKLVHERLVAPLGSALREAKQNKRAARREQTRVPHGGREHTVLLEVVPLRHSSKDYFLVCLSVPAGEPTSVSRSSTPSDTKAERGRGVKAVSAGAGKTASALRRRTADLERDLAEAHAEARSLKEEHETVVEEMNAANEEAMSANEEFQSLNEEMEAAKEELESANEELTTVNDEMLKQNAVLARTASDLSNTENVAALDIIVVDGQGLLRRFTRSAAARFSLKNSDLGRTLHSLANLPEGLPSSVTQSITDMKALSLELQGKARRWLAVRIAPAVGPDGKVEGAVLSFHDIDAQKRGEIIIKEGQQFAEAIIRTVRDGLLVMDHELRAVRANEAFCTMFRTSEAQVVGKLLFDLSAGQWNSSLMHNRFDDMVARNSTFDGLEMTHEVAGYGRRTFLVGGRTLREPGADANRILVSVRDITEAMQFQVRDRADSGLYRRLFDTSSDGLLLANVETGAIREANENMLDMLGCTAKEALLLNLADLSLSASDGPIRIDLVELRKRGALYIPSCSLRSKSGTRRIVELRLRVHHDVLAPFVVVNVRDRKLDDPA